MIFLFKNILEIPYDIEPLEIFGVYNNRIKYVKEKLEVEINYSHKKITFMSEKKGDSEKAYNIFRELVEVLESGHLPDWTEFLYIANHYISMELELEPKIVKNNGTDKEPSLKLSMKDIINTTVSGIKITAKTKGQSEYIKIIKENDVVFCIGPAGTGKTYLAVANAVEQLRTGKYQRIILTRPAVEAGEKLGFLPGTLYEKIDPYLKPLYDALMDFMPADKVIALREKSVIEVIPLAYMRGRTLNNSFIILDEAQNTTYQQMKMFLTRLGFNSKVIVTGDITQIDLEKKKDSGLLAVRNILRNVETVKFCELSKEDVVRNAIVKDIIEAYEKFEIEKEIEKDKINQGDL